MRGSDRALIHAATLAVLALIAERAKARAK